MRIMLKLDLISDMISDRIRNMMRSILSDMQSHMIPDTPNDIRLDQIQLQVRYHTGCFL